MLDKPVRAYFLELVKSKEFEFNFVLEEKKSDETPILSHIPAMFFWKKKENLWNAFFQDEDSTIWRRGSQLWEVEWWHLEEKTLRDEIAPKLKEYFLAHKHILSTRKGHGFSAQWLWNSQESSWEPEPFPVQVPVFSTLFCLKTTLTLEGKWQQANSLPLTQEVKSVGLKIDSVDTSPHSQNL